MALLYPPVEPYASGLVEVGDGQRLYWEQCGNPKGKPAVVLHGGPGSGCSPAMRQLFDPSLYRVVLFDQRGAGRSRPHASEMAADLAVNTTHHHLVADMEALREHFGIDRWLVHGNSWGSTLALAYSQAHAERVSELVLSAVVTTSRADVDWFTRGVGCFFPAEWEALHDTVPEADRDGDLVTAYARLLRSPQASVRQDAARSWCAWEEAVVSAEGTGAPNPRYEDERFRLGFARLVTHYFSNAAWLAPLQLLGRAGLLAGIPGVLIHGRLDLGFPPHNAWRLSRAWRGSSLVVLGASGHGAEDIRRNVVSAADRFAGKR